MTRASTPMPRRCASGQKDISGSKPGSLPCTPVHRWLHGNKLLRYSASPKGRTCASTVFSQPDAVVNNCAARARKVSSVEKSSSALSR